MLRVEFEMDDDAYVSEYAKELIHKKFRSQGFKQQMKELVDIEVKKKMVLAAKEISDYYYEQDVMVSYLQR